jgi:hypothetical protein
MTQSEFFLLQSACDWARARGQFAFFWHNYRVYRNGGESISSAVDCAMNWCVVA